MIVLRPGEEVDFMFRTSAKIDRKKVGSGWFYLTEQRLAFESDKHGICFEIKPMAVDGQKGCRWGRFKFTWIEETPRGRWRFLFEGKVEKWDGWKPTSKHVAWLIQGASYGTRGLLGAGWRSHKGEVYNEIKLSDEALASLHGRTPEEQWTYRRWRTVKALLKDGDFDFACGKYDNSESLERLNRKKIVLVKLDLRDYRRESRRVHRLADEAIRDPKKRAKMEREGITPKVLESHREKCAVQERILEIIKGEYKEYTFGKHLDRRVDELRDTLGRMYRRNEDISSCVPPSAVRPAMAQARKDIEEFRRRLTVKLPVV